MSDTTGTPRLSLVSDARVERSRDLARRCADFADMQNRPGWTQHRPHELYAAIGNIRLSANARLVFAVLRQALRCGFAGLWVSYDELAELAGCHARTARRCIEQLVRTRLVTKDPQYTHAWEGSAAQAAGYALAQLRNAYTLGPAAKAPRRRGGAGPPKVSDKSRDKKATLRPEGSLTFGQGTPSQFNSGDAPPSNPAQSPAVIRRPRPELVALPGGRGAESPSGRRDCPDGSGDPSSSPQRASRGQEHAPGQWPPRLAESLSDEQRSLLALCPTVATALFDDTDPTEEPT